MQSTAWDTTDIIVFNFIWWPTVTRPVVTILQCTQIWNQWVVGMNQYTIVGQLYFDKNKTMHKWTGKYYYPYFIDKGTEA